MKTAEDQFYRDYPKSPSGREWDKFEKEHGFFDVGTVIDFAERYAKQFKQEWISVKDRLPEHEQQVLFWKVYRNTPTKAIKLGTFWLNEGRKKPCFTTQSTLDYVSDGKVTHWMPLPEPPENITLPK